MVRFRVYRDFANAISSTTLDEDQLRGFVAAEHNHPWAVPDKDYIRTERSVINERDGHR
jgi:hypothetical protein